MPIYAIDGIVPVVDPTAFVHPDAVLIGDVIVAAACYVAPLASLRGDFGRIVMHPGSNVQDCCVMHGFPNCDTVIGAGGHIGHAAVLHGCTLEDDVLIGMNATIMDGVTVGAESIVAANAFVKAGFEAPARSLIAGVPGKIVRSVTDEELAWKQRGTKDYQELALRSRRSLQPVEPLSEAEPGRRRIEVSDLQPLYKSKDTTRNR